MTRSFFLPGVVKLWLLAGVVRRVDWVEVTCGVVFEGSTHTTTSIVTSLGAWVSLWRSRVIWTKLAFVSRFTLTAGPASTCDVNCSGTLPDVEIGLSRSSRSITLIWLTLVLVGNRTDLTVAAGDIGKIIMYALSDAGKETPFSFGFTSVGL